MTINNIGASYQHLGAEGRLAALIVSNEAIQQTADQQLLDEARQNFIEESDAEVAAMRAEADAIEVGAWRELATVSLGVALQGASLAGEAIAFDNQKAGRVLSGMQGIGSVIGSTGAGAVGQFNGAEIKGYQADATAARGAAGQAQWEVDDRQQAIASSQGDQDQAVRWLGDAVSADAATTNAILSNMA